MAVVRGHALAVTACTLALLGGLAMSALALWGSVAVCGDRSACGNDDGVETTLMSMSMSMPMSRLRTPMMMIMSMLITMVLLMWNCTLTLY